MKVYRTDELLVLFDCVDRAALPAKLTTLGMRHHVCRGDGFVAMSDRDFSDELRVRARILIPPS